MVGTKLGPYVLRAPLGVGGMGTVWLAEHELMRRTAAVKVLLVGTTPYRGEVPRIGDSTRLRLRLDGYHTEDHVASNNQPIVWEVKLTARPALDAGPPLDASTGGVATLTPDPRALLASAQRAAKANQWQRALAQAEQALAAAPDRDTSVAAIAVVGLAACRLEDRTKAARAVARLPTDKQRQVRQVCAKAGVHLDAPEAEPRPTGTPGLPPP